MNAIKQVADPANTFQANVIYWGYWKPSGEIDVVTIPTSSSSAIGLESLPVIKRPILGPSKSPNRPSVNTLTPASLLNLGATGGKSIPQTVTDLSSLTGTALDDSIIKGIKSIFNSGNQKSGDGSTYVNNIVDLYSKYPQVSKDKFLGLYDKATFNILNYSVSYIQSLKDKLKFQL